MFNKCWSKGIKYKIKANWKEEGGIRLCSNSNNNKSTRKPLDNVDDGFYRILPNTPYNLWWRSTVCHFSPLINVKKVVSWEKASPSASALCVLVCMVGPPDPIYVTHLRRYEWHLMEQQSSWREHCWWRKKNIRKEASSAQYDLNKISEYLNREFIRMVCGSDVFHPLVVEVGVGGLGFTTMFGDRSINVCWMESATSAATRELIKYSFILVYVIFDCKSRWDKRNAGGFLEL